MNVYMLFPTDKGNLDENIDTKEKNQLFLEEIQMSINRIRFEKDTQLYYDDENKTELIILLSDNAEMEQYGIFDIEVIINELLYESNANPILALSNDDFDYAIVSFKTFYFYDFPLIFKIIINEKFSTPTDKNLFFNFKRAYHCFNIIDDITIHKFSNLKRHIIPQATNFKDLDEWLIANRLKRNYNREDNRHIEGHPDYRPDLRKSPIIGGIGAKKRLEKLLKFALSDYTNKDLIVFDKEVDRFIWYEYENENPQNLYHGYHLVEFGSKPDYDRDLKAEESIPKEVIDLFTYREKID